MRKDYTKYLGDDKSQVTWSESDEGLCFDTLPWLPEIPKPIYSWHPEWQYREEKDIDGTRHRYL